MKPRKKFLGFFIRIAFLFILLPATQTRKKNCWQKTTLEGFFWRST